MAFTTPEQFQKLVAQLNEVAKAYSDLPDVNGTKSRTAITEKAKSIVQAMMDPSDMGMHHLVNVSTPQSTPLMRLEPNHQLPDDRTCGYTYIAQVQGA